MPGSDDHLGDLVQAAREGGREAVSALLEAVLPDVRRMVHARLQHGYRRNNDWAFALFSTGDVVQDTLLGVVKDIARFEGDEGRLMAWLATQVEHRILQRLRFFGSAKRDQRRVRVLDAGTETQSGPVDGRSVSPAAASETAELWDAVASAMASLADAERAILEASFEDDLSWADIARRVGLPSAESARMRHRRAKARLCLRLATRFPGTFGGAGRDDDGA